MELKNLADEIKGKGIESALLKRDGALVYSTFGMDDPAPHILQYLTNNAQLLMAELEDEAREIELSFKDKFIVIIPIANYILVGLVKTREDKKVLREYRDTIQSML